MAYTAAGERMSVTSAIGTESYAYNADGLLTQTFIDGRLRAARVEYDANGNVLTYHEYDDVGEISLTTKTTYSADNRVLTETTDGNTVSYDYDEVGNLVRTVNPNGGDRVSTFYRYEYWDGAKQKEIKAVGTVTTYEPAHPWKPGFSHFVYDANGHLTRVSDKAANRHLSYTLNHAGQILQRNELIGATTSRSQNYYYLNGNGVGDAGGFGTSKMDYTSLLAARGQAVDSETRVRAEWHLLKDNTVYCRHGEAAFFAAVAISGRLLRRKKHASQ